MKSKKLTFLALRVYRKNTQGHLASSENQKKKSDPAMYFLVYLMEKPGLDDWVSKQGSFSFSGYGIL